MLKRNCLLAFLFLCLLKNVFSQARNLVTQRSSTSITIDGNLEDWTTIPFTEDFTQFEPKPGLPSKYQTKVAVVYDDQAIYIAAEVYDTMSLIRSDLSPRDELINADWFGVLIDTYKNGLTGTSFRVTAAGVQLDERWSGDSDDSNWDAVWDSEVKHYDDKWVVEYKIPYAALRFSEAEEQEWFIQFARYVRRSREFAHWNAIDPNQDGIIRQSGVLSGLNNITSPLRLSLTPFVVGNHANLEGDGTTTFSAGMDLKYGINEAFTLDMTLIPDFNQVQSDDQVVNLGPFEVFFEERRQFFTEGTELFNRANLFYSRRIGGNLFYQDRIDDAGEDLTLSGVPSKAQLLNASKVSGRFANGSGLGMFNAFEGRSTITAEDSLGNISEIEVHPFTNYNVIVYEHALNNNSYVSIVNTNVLRKGSAYDANVTGTEFQVRDKNQKFEISGDAAVNQKFFSTGTEYGHKAGVDISDINGKWTSTLGYSEESANYDPNDLGFLFSPNERGAYYNIQYQEFEPKNFTRWNVWSYVGVNGLYKPSVLTSWSFNAGGFWFTKKFFAFGGFMSYQPRSRDYFEPRTSDFSKYYAFPSYFGFSPFISTDWSKKYAIDIRFSHFHNFNNPRKETGIEISPRIQVNPSCFLFLTTGINWFKDKEAYIDKDLIDYSDYGLLDEDVAFGLRNRQVVNNSFRLNYIFTNKMSANIRVRHYWDKVNYTEYYKLNDDGSLTAFPFDGFDEEGNEVYKGNFNFFNIDLNYIWRFAPGSDLILTYKNNAFTDPELDRYTENFNSIFQQRSNHLVSLKILYFLDWNALSVGSNMNKSKSSNQDLGNRYPRLRNN